MESNENFIEKRSFFFNININIKLQTHDLIKISFTNISLNKISKTDTIYTYFNIF